MENNIRVETGKTQFQNDWSGIFIRGDDCANFYINLKILVELIEKNSTTEQLNDLFIFILHLKNMVNLLQTANDHHDTKIINELKQYKECVK